MYVPAPTKAKNVFPRKRFEKGHLEIIITPIDRRTVNLGSLFISADPTAGIVLGLNVDPRSLPLSAPDRVTRQAKAFTTRGNALIWHIYEIGNIIEAFSDA